jgi:nitroreductase
MSASPIHPDHLLEALNWRYATKKFDPARKISDADWTAIEDALVLAPSSFGLQPWRFYLVKNPALLAQLPEHSWNQTQPVDCSHFVVFAQRKNLSNSDVDTFIQRVADVRGAAKESLEGYRGMMAGFVKTATEQGWLNPWAARQVYIALGQAMTAAALLGIDTCALEGINPAKYDEILGITNEGYTALCGLAFGYRSPEDGYATMKKVRYAKQDVIRVL